MAGFDEKCPHCDCDINCDYHWRNGDYSNCFKIECKCGKQVEIEVEFSPVFSTSKVMCAMCGRREPEGTHYCKVCSDKIKEHESENSYRMNAK